MHIYNINCIRSVFYYWLGSCIFARPLTSSKVALVGAVQLYALNGATSISIVYATGILYYQFLLYFFCVHNNKNNVCGAIHLYNCHKTPQLQSGSVKLGSYIFPHLCTHAEDPYSFTSAFGALSSAKSFKMNVLSYDGITAASAAAGFTEEQVCLPSIYNTCNYCCNMEHFSFSRLLGLRIDHLGVFDMRRP